MCKLNNLFERSGHSTKQERSTVMQEQHADTVIGSECGMYILRVGVV